MPESIHDIIVATDFSELSDAAIRSAVVLARGHDATIHLLHVVRLPFVHTTYDVNVPQFVWDGLRDEVRLQMDEVSTRLASEGIVRVEQLISENLQPAEFIEQHARALAADFVVLATHGRRGLAHAFLGSVAEKTLRTCPAPVLAVKQQGLPEEGIRRVLIAVDFSKHSDRALELAVSLARTSGASIDLLHVLEEAPEYAIRVSPEIAEFEARARAKSAERLESAGAALEKTGLSVRTHLQKGYPPDVISRRAASCKSDLIVMGTHGHRGFDRLALGSVAERTLRLAPCAVLTTRVEA